jgi:galactosamine-6-phosphate isomerase
MNSLVQVCEDGESLSRRAAQHVLTALTHKPNLLLCAASGSTPVRTYQLLAEQCALKPDEFRSLRVVKLDEWGGLAPDDPGTCEHQVRNFVVAPLGVTPDRYFGFASNPSDPAAECDRIRRRLAAEGPIDLCVLGLGLNGHLALNEPAPYLQAEAHVASLADGTLRHPMLANSRARPAYGLTLGMAEILASREILLLVSGTKKRAPMQKLLRREVATDFPASFLWLHPHWTLLCDREAARGLDLKP